MDLASRIAAALGHPGGQIEREVIVAPGLVADYLVKTPDRLFVVDVKSRPARPEDVAQVLLFREILSTRHPGIATQGVIVSPGAAARVHKIATASGIRLLKMTPDQLPRGVEDVGRWPLSSEQSWRVVTSLIEKGQAKGVRDLARSTGVSAGWVSKVMRELQARNIVQWSNGQYLFKDPSALLDAIAAERPFKTLESGRVATGLEDPDDVILTLQMGWKDLIAVKGKPGAIVCGVTAAAFHSGYSVHHDRMEVYSHALDALRGVFGKKTGGVELVVFRPDRDVNFESSFGDGFPTVSPQQALLDVGGTGLTYRDLALRLIEVLKK